MELSDLENLSKYFSKSVVVVTGGGQGIGSFISKVFASKGANVELDEEAGLETEKLIKDQNQSALFVKTDVSQEESVKNMVKQAEEKFGAIHSLINNAGIYPNVDIFSENSVQMFDKVLSVNLRGSYICAKYCAQSMVKHKIQGTIINIASTRAFMSEANTEPYTSSKGGVISLTHSLAISLSKYKIRVNSISPGWIDVSGMKKSSDTKQAVLSAKDHEQHPVGRVGVANDIAQACLYFASPASSFITGQNLTVDGGMTVKMIYHDE